MKKKGQRRKRVEVMVLLKGKFKTKKGRVGRWVGGEEKEMKKIIIKKWKR